MTDTGDLSPSPAPAETPRRAVGLFRLAVGLAQGAMVWWLIRSASGGRAFMPADAAPPTLAWPASQPVLYAALLLATVMAPIVLLGAAGRMRWRWLAVWGLVAAGVVGGFGAWEAMNQIAPEWRRSFEPSFPTVMASLAILFVAHHLLLPALQARRWIAPYPAYFDTAWKAGVQLALSAAFVGAFWLLLFLGAGLFRVIGVEALSDLIGKDWFAAPATTLSFAAAVHLTDVRDGLIRGVRTVALMLLSWLLPVMTGLVAAFLIALPFTGLDGLFRGPSATAMMLAAAAALIILINAAYQDGDPEDRPARPLRWAAPAAALLLTPLVALALWGLALRIGQHGLTPERIIALSCALVGAVYAGGYGWAAVATLRRRAWMAPLERTNVAAAVSVVLVILALFSPVADPVRLSINDQLDRLERGAVSAEEFDYAFLRFDAGRAGQRALGDLARSDDAEVARRAADMQAVQERYQLGVDQTSVQTVTPVIQPWPADAVTPTDFLAPVALPDPRAQCDTADACLVQALDLDGDGADELLLAQVFSVHLFARNAAGAWTYQGEYRRLSCGPEDAPDARQLMRDGSLTPRPRRWPDLEIGGEASPLVDETTCPIAAEAQVADTP
ncbi:DUF4153 domain-containing protein [Brevundimonas lutea]|uniref:DUF4153 domain-containing protein n=1 Tax=Brevundimonas lutea TaxID=2293980 RepID=UPI000F042474|nr:DUF4153 domain-containing protein [Brevundimonas lutea]